MPNATARFYTALPPFDDFSRIVAPDVYRPLPDDWWIGLTDVVGSTAAIADGRYKQVNMAGAAVISAVMNALDSREFPFVFGGDGASFAVSADEKETAQDALARTSGWVADTLDLELRAAMVSVKTVRDAGHDIRIARFAASKDVTYANFAGRGLDWAEVEMKAGHYAVAMDGEHMPDLTGLSCRWQPLPAERGCILSLLVVPGPTADDVNFNETVSDILSLTGGVERGGHPLPERGPRFVWPPGGVEDEIRAMNDGRSLFRRRLRVWLESVFAIALDRTGLSAGRFDPVVYRAELAANSDFRKFDDALRMTIDCDDGLVRRLETYLKAAAEKGLVRFGLHRQDEALMTCIVPSAVESDHMHFLDGADGGYARAAQALKATA